MQTSIRAAVLALLPGRGPASLTAVVVSAVVVSGAADRSDASDA